MELNTCILTDLLNMGKRVDLGVKQNKYLDWFCV